MNLLRAVGLAAACCLAVMFFVKPSWSQTDAEDPTAEAMSVLRQYDQPADTATQLAFLQSQLPDPNRVKRLDELVVDLADNKFKIREAAHEELLNLGLAARPHLIAATQSNDEEVRWRARRILRRLDSRQGLDRREALTYASLRLLGHRREPEAVEVMLAIATQVEQQHLFDAAREAVWRCVDDSHEKLLRQKIAGSDVRIQAVSIVALEVAVGDDAVEAVEPFLRDKHDELRLAAARALIERQPRVVAQVLIELLGSEKIEIQVQAQALLRSLFDVEMEVAAGQSLEDLWKQWAKDNLETAKPSDIGVARLDLQHGRGSLFEEFSVASNDVTKGYGRFGYEAKDANTSAKVTGGVLRLEGTLPETDQRLFITSERLTGRPAWPRTVELSAKISGESSGSGGYHVGLSVGQVKALFHPDHSGGGFRIEGVDSHDYWVSNKSMGFTPTAKVMHHMTLRVTRTATGADIEVEVTQGNGQAKFTATHSVTEKQLGKYNRVGLERSGRAGGAALFDDVKVRLKS